MNPISFKAQLVFTEPLKNKKEYNSSGLSELNTSLTKEFSKATENENYNLVIYDYNKNGDTIFHLRKNSSIIEAGTFKFLDNPVEYTVQNLLKIYQKLLKREDFNNEKSLICEEHQDKITEQIKKIKETMLDSAESMSFDEIDRINEFYRNKLIELQKRYYI